MNYIDKYKYKTYHVTEDGITYTVIDWYILDEFFLQEWSLEGKLHRMRGPAKSPANKWYYQGEYLDWITSQEEFEQWLKLRMFI